MNFRKLPLIFVVLLVFLFKNTSEVQAFSDLKNHWSSEYVEVLSEQKLVNGYEDGTFKPDNNITRGEFYKIINNLVGFNKTYAVSFSDVSKSDWFYEEVAKGIKAGYITPTTGKLNPNSEISREEAIWIIGYVYNLAPNVPATRKFIDKDHIKTTYAGFIGNLVEKKIVDGFPDGSFQPKKGITRGEMSKILNLCITQFGKPEIKVLVDSEIKFGPKGLYE